MSAALKIISPGPHTTIQGARRLRYQDIGIPASGPLDPVSLRLGIGAPPGSLGITQVDAQCLRAGCNVVLRGYGFGMRPNDQWVTVAGRRVRVRMASPNALEISLPRRFVGTTTIRVQLRSGEAAESPPITITP